MDILCQDILDSFTHLNEKEIIVELHGASLKPKQEQITSFGLTDEGIQKQVTQNDASWKVDPISLKQLKELDWSTPATESCTNNPLFPYLPYLEYQYDLSFHSTSPPPCTPLLPVVHRLSYQYITERRRRKREGKGEILTQTSAAVVSSLKIMENLDKFELRTIEKLQHYKTINNTSVMTDILDDKGENKRESVDNYDIKPIHDETVIDKMVLCGADHESMDMPTSYFRPERDVSNFESIQKVPNLESPMHSDCELDNYRFQFV